MARTHIMILFVATLFAFCFSLSTARANTSSRVLFMNTVCSNEDFHTDVFLTTFQHAVADVNNNILVGRDLGKLHLCNEEDFDASHASLYSNYIVDLTVNQSCQHSKIIVHCVSKYKL